MYLRFYLIYFAILCCKASDYKFSLTRSKDWQSPGRLVQYTLKVVISESSPIKTKIKLPFNDTAILRLTKAEIAEVSPKLHHTLNSTSMTSSAGDDLNDIAVIDLGEVTRAPSDDETAVKFAFEVQVLNHPRIVNGGTQMVSVGTQYKNNSIWVAQLALKAVLPPYSRPDLSAEFWPVLDYHGVLTSSQISLRVIVKHSPQTSAEVDGGVIEWPKVSFLEYERIAVYNSSVTVNTIDTPKAVYFKFGSLGFAQQVNFEFKVNLDPRKEMADGKIHKCTTYLNVKFNGSVDACTSSSGFREFSHPVSSHFKFYVPQSCDQPLGMDSNTITDDQITASSYSSDGQPHQARLRGSKAWIPSGTLANDKSQFLQVNFTTKVKIRRISTRGSGKGFSDDRFGFVSRFFIFYSDDGVLWKPYKEASKIKEFVGNSDNLFSQTIVLPIPIEAVFIRINPTCWGNNISLRVEFYGCVLYQSPLDSSLLKLTSRAYLLDKTNDTMFVCSVPMEIKTDVSKCYFSTDQGVNWTAIDNHVLTILGFDPSDGVLYGVGLNGKAVLRSSPDHTAKFTGVPLYAWEEAAMKPSAVRATMLGSHVAITDDPSSVTPQSEHTVISSNGNEWGVSAKGVHVKESSTWKLRGVWI